MGVLKCRIVLMEDKWVLEVTRVIMEVEMDRVTILVMGTGTMLLHRGKLKLLRLGVLQMISQN